MNTSSLLRELSHPDPEGSDLLLVGGGPRSVIQTSSEILFMLIYRSHFEQLIKMGAQYQINTTIIEKQSVLGMGASFSGGQTGMMNTGIEDCIVFPLPLSSPSKHHDTLKMLLSYKRRYEYMLENGREEYYKQVRKVNLPGAVLFKRNVGPSSATMDGTLDHSEAYLMRKTVGEEEHTTFEKLRKLASYTLPFYRLQVHNSSIVSRISIRKKGQPIVEIQQAGSHELSHMRADQIRLNTGTTTKNPISDKVVRHYTFCQAMNAVDYKNHCMKRGLLDDDSRLKPGTRILSGGFGLSGLDQISVLDHVMNLFEEDDSELLGYRVTDEARERYKGAISVLSRSVGKVIPPRHGFGFEWLQGTPVMGSTKHIHSLFLHGAGEEVFRIWIDILTATIARATNRTPNQVSDVSETTEDLLRSQFQESKWFLKCRKKAGIEEKRGNMVGKEHFLRESSKTLFGAWRQASLSLIFGFGLEPNGISAQTEMREFAPITWKGREFWLIHRAQVTSITNPRFASEGSNKVYYNNWTEIMRHVTSSPTEVQSMFHLLFEAGIAKHVTKSYSEIRSGGKKLELGGEDYDSLIVSPVFNRNDNIIRSMTGQLRAYDGRRPAYGEVGKFRRFVKRDGSLVSVEDYGLGGKGFEVENKAGSLSQMGAFATDINNRSSGVSVASTVTLRRMALAHMKAAGLKRPEDLFDRIYENTKPSEEAYEDEVQKFKKYFEESFEMWAYLKAISKAAGNDSKLFQILFDAGLTASDRTRQLKKMENGATALNRQAYTLYRARLQETPMFNPPCRDEYLTRFVDTTEEEDTVMYTKAYAMSRRHLEKQRKERHSSSWNSPE